MAALKMILKDTAGGTEFVFPVTPESFSVSSDREVLKVNIHQMGEVNLWGLKKAATLKISAQLPSGERSYAFSGGYVGNPYGAIELLQGWQTAGKVLRYIVSDTPVNLPVLLSSLSYGEQDGTRDVYVQLVLEEYRETGAVQVQSGAQQAARPAESGGVMASPQRYTVVKGDTMWAIARKYYGDPTLCWKLAQYNGIPNANLIYPGQVVSLPDKGAL